MGKLHNFWCPKTIFKTFKAQIRYIRYVLQCNKNANQPSTKRFATYKNNRDIILNIFLNSINLKKKFPLSLFDSIAI